MDKAPTPRSWQLRLWRAWTILALASVTHGQRFGFKDVKDIFGTQKNGADKSNGLKVDKNGIITENNVHKLRPEDFGLMVDARFEELMDACVSGDLEEVKKILKERPHSINHRSVVMPLHAAVQHRRLKVMIWLIDHGADVNARTEDGSTAIALATYNGDLEIVKMLAERGGDPAVKNQQGYNAMDVADAQNYPEIKEYLMTPGRFQNAARQGDIPTVKRMLKKKPWRINEIRLFSALHAAARFNHTELVKVLLDEGANTDVQMMDYSTPLILAAAEGNFEVVKILIANDADYIHVNMMGYDAYKAASSQGHKEVADFLGALQSEPMEDSDSAEGQEGDEEAPQDAGSEGGDDVIDGGEEPSSASDSTSADADGVGASGDTADKVEL